MCMTVADASVFIWGKRPEGELITVPAVEAELKDIRARSRLHIYETRVESPTTIALKAARDAAEQTGDIRSLSAADLEVLAKVIITDQANLKTETSRKTIDETSLVSQNNLKLS